MIKDKGNKCCYRDCHGLTNWCDQETAVCRSHGVLEKRIADLEAKIEDDTNAVWLHHSDIDVACMFHENYERLAPFYQYETREESAVPWDEVPAYNKCLMIATVEAVRLKMVEKKS